MVLVQQKSPSVRLRKLLIIVFAKIGIADENAEIHEPLLQAFGDLPVIAAVKMKMDVGMCLMKLFHGLDEKPHAFGFSASDINIAGYGPFFRMKCSLCFIRQFDDFLGTLLEKHAFFCKRYFSFAADEQPFSKLVFQIHQLL